jgi:hypothetical protein
MSVQLKGVGYNAFSLGGLIKGIGDVAGGILTGNPVGGIVSGIHDAFGPGGNPQPPTPPELSTPMGGDDRGEGWWDWTKRMVQGGGASSNGKCGVCPKGYHLNKHTLPPSKKHGWVPARTWCVRNRHMHPLNSRAASRSITRLKRAGKMFRKIGNFVGPKHHRAPAKCGCKR